MEAAEQRPFVSEYYGKTLKSSADLLTSACCPVDAVPPAHRAILSQLHPDVTSRFYGCGSPIPDFLSGAVILDLGCGTGRDAFLASALAGQKGKVIGVDMTMEQLEVARATAEYHAKKFFGEDGKVNTEFREGYIEDLAGAGVGDGEVDVVISNCVCNLSTDKRGVFSEVARVLKEGGEFYFSDVYTDRRLSEEAQRDPVLVAECLGGALYIEDFRRIMSDVGFKDIRIMTSAPIQLHDSRMRELVPDVQFYSLTIRAFKIASLEDRRENYGQTATYSSCCGSGLKLDKDYNFVKGKTLPVDANTATILQKARFADKFTVTPAGSHLGLFSPDIEGGAIGATLGLQQQAKGGQGCGPLRELEDQSTSGGAACGVPREIVGHPIKTAKVDVNGGNASACC
eukprot:GFKZ01013655.1.p1 GENE.GFKZ01013655.1~~GFKZ01013655.1.p1  ORF type:complete len:399 (-),score=51.18 GFKZ01013655.1:497-1693(-)